MSSKSRVLSHYRSILRHVASLPTSGEGKIVEKSCGRQWQAVAAAFKAGKVESDVTRAEQLRKNAASYAEMVSSVAELKVLRGLDTGEKMSPRDTIQASAARVGLHVPRFADDELPSELPEAPTNPHLRP
jgi:hypothetical protein